MKIKEANADLEASISRFEKKITAHLSVQAWLLVSFGLLSVLATIVKLFQ